MPVQPLHCRGTRCAVRVWRSQEAVRPRCRWEKIISELPTFQSWAGGDLQVEVEEIPLADVAAAWLRPNNGRRIVLRV